MRVLIVEDDKDINDLIKFFFEKESYEVITTLDGLEGFKLAKEKTPDLIILDLMLPSLDGVNFTKMLRENGLDAKIIMVTAKTDVEDVIEGLEIGANDYIRKPFDPRELVIRAKKLLGNVSASKKKKILSFKEVEIDTESYKVLEAGREISLSKKEYNLIYLLMTNREIVLTREEILEKVWKSTYYSGDRTVDIYISKLREKLKSISKDIRTVKGVGYKLEEKR